MGYTTFGNFKKNDGLVVLSFHDCEYEYIESDKKPLVLNGSLKYFVKSPAGHQLALVKKIEIPRGFFLTSKKSKGYWAAKTTVEKLGKWLESQDVSDKYNISGITKENVKEVFEAMLTDIKNEKQKQNCRESEEYFFDKISAMSKGEYEYRLSSMLGNLFFYLEWQDSGVLGD